MSVANEIQRLEEEKSAYEYELNKPNIPSNQRQVYQTNLTNINNRLNQLRGRPSPAPTPAVSPQPTTPSVGGVTKITQTKDVYGNTRTVEENIEGTTVKTSNAPRFGAVPPAQETFVSPLIVYGKSSIDYPTNEVYGRDYVEVKDPLTGERVFTTPEEVSKYNKQTFLSPMEGTNYRFGETLTFKGVETKVWTPKGTVGGTFTTLEQANINAGFSGMKTLPDYAYDIGYGATPFLSEKSRMSFGVGAKRLASGISSIFTFIPSTLRKDRLRVIEREGGGDSAFNPFEGKGYKNFMEFLEADIYEPTIYSLESDQSRGASELIGGMIGGEIFSKIIGVGVRAVNRLMIPSVTNVEPSFVVTKADNDLYRLDVKSKVTTKSNYFGIEGVNYFDDVSYMTKPSVVKGTTYSKISSANTLSGTGSVSYLGKPYKSGISKVTPFTTGKIESGIDVETVPIFKRRSTPTMDFFTPTTTTTDYQLGKIYTFKGVRPPIIISGSAETRLFGSLGGKDYIPFTGIGIDMSSVNVAGGGSSGVTSTMTGTKSIGKQFIGEISKVVSQQVVQNQKLFTTNLKTISGESSAIVGGLGGVTTSTKTDTKFWETVKPVIATATSTKTLTIPKQRLATMTGLLTGVAPKEKVLSQTMTGTATSTLTESDTKIIAPTLTKTKLKTTIIPAPINFKAPFSFNYNIKPPVFIPLLPADDSYFGGGIRKRVKRISNRFSRDYDYSPTWLGISGARTVKKEPKMRSYSGVEVRPYVQKKKKFRLF